MLQFPRNIPYILYSIKGHIYLADITYVFKNE